MEQIIHKGVVLAIRIKKIPRGSTPATNEKESLQLVTLKHPKGAYLKAHMHKPLKRVTSSLQECLVVKKGKIRVDLYTQNKDYVKFIKLKEGELLIIMKAGIGITFLEDSEIMEFKNGPFKEDKILI